jgi:hypothetical protein
MVFHTLLRGPGSLGAGNGEVGIRGKTRSRTYAVFVFPRSRSFCERLGCSCLVLLTPLFFAETLTREGLFGATLFPGFHVVAVLLDFLDDVFRLHLPLEAPESVLQ